MENGSTHSTINRMAFIGNYLPLDLDTPERCLKRSDEWVFGPEEPFEQRGDVDHVVFPCGYTLHLYYGAADTSIALAAGSVRAMLEWLEQHG